MIHNFRSGDLGIVLGTAVPPRLYADIVGTQDADNTVLDNSMPHQTTLFATAEAQKVFGLGGAEAIVLSYANTIGYGMIAGEESQSPQGGETCWLDGSAGRDALLGAQQQPLARHHFH